jgi:hypothetical protein
MESIVYNRQINTQICDKYLKRIIFFYKIKTSFNSLVMISLIIQKQRFGTKSNLNRKIKVPQGYNILLARFALI